MIEKQVFGNSKDQIQVVGQKEVNKHQKLVGKIRTQRGHKIFQLDLNSKEITEAEIITSDPVLLPNRTTKTNKRLDIKPSHLYCSALNQKNACKHFYKMLEKAQSQNV